ncbi:MAG TPA: MbtH family protein [Longimicrobium sp.]|jgi:MbtH protein
MSQGREDSTIYRLLVNGGGQYSIVPVNGAVPAGWRDVGKAGHKDECLAYIDRAWPEMRPRRGRVAMHAPGLR